MSPRERNLLIFFATGGFALVTFLLFNFLNGQRDEARSARDDARRNLEVARQASSLRGSVQHQIEWMEEHMPPESEYQTVQSELQQFAEQQAVQLGLTIKPGSQTFLTTVTGEHFHRARISLALVGNEQALYNWFDRVNDPEQFRAATRIRIGPDNTDDTLIDCLIEVDQWFVPAPDTEA